MTWTFTAIVDTTVSYIIHKSYEITSKEKDKHLLYFITFPESIYYTEDLLQAHFSELKILNKIGFKLRRILSISTIGLMVSLLIYMIISSFSSANFENIFQII